MNWSFRLGRIAGIPVFIHWTFALLLVLLWWFFSAHSDNWLQALGSVVMILLIFGCVLLHELGHALAARRYGIGTESITMLPIGGLARLQSMPKEPGKEIVVALAGPAVNVAIAILLFLLLVLVSAGQAILSMRAIFEGVNIDSFLGRLEFLFYANVILVLFNLIPAFPMDGGRVLRAVLAISLPYAEATRWAARVGQIVAVGFVIWGAIGQNWMLFFIALFVFIGAEAEAAAAEQSAIFAGMTVNDAVQPRFRTLQETDSLALAVNELLSGSQHNFPVMREGEVVGILNLYQLLRGLKELSYMSPVSEIMSTEWMKVDPDEPLEGVIEEMAATQQPMVPVVRKGRLVGIITTDNVRELIMVRSALREASPMVPATPEAPSSPIGVTPPAPDASAGVAKG